MSQDTDSPLREVISLLEQAVKQLRRVVVDDTTRVLVSGQGHWTQGMFADVARAVRHLPGVVALFDLTAERSDAVAEPTRVSFSEVTARSGLDEAEQRTNHARLSRVSRRILGSTSWPVESWQDHVSGEMQYRMPPAIAAWWREVRAEPQPLAESR